MIWKGQEKVWRGLKENECGKVQVYAHGMDSPTWVDDKKLSPLIRK